jgi:hypothetical protein
MTTVYTDAGWTGAPAAVTAALAAYGYQVNNDNSVTVIDPQLNTVGIVAVTGYRVLDEAAYVLTRSTAAVALPAGVTAIGADHTSAISGVFMADGTAPPTTISSLAFFNRFTPAETGAVWAAAVGNPGIGAGLMNGLAAGAVILDGAALSAWMNGLVAANVLTQARHDVILTP